MNAYSKGVTGRIRRDTGGDVREYVSRENNVSVGVD